MQRPFSYVVRGVALFTHIIGTISCATRYNASVEFTWDSSKAAANITNHRVSFEGAQTVFNDPLYLDFFDPDHSLLEDRSIIVGKSDKNRLFVVSYTERAGAIRIITARKAINRERKDYEEGYE